MSSTSNHGIHVSKLISDLNNRMTNSNINSGQTNNIHLNRHVVEVHKIQQGK
jgi:hypothetical protein